MLKTQEISSLLLQYPKMQKIMKNPAVMQTPENFLGYVPASFVRRLKIYTTQVKMRTEWLGCWGRAAEMRDRGGLREEREENWRDWEWEEKKGTDKWRERGVCVIRVISTVGLHTLFAIGLVW